VAAVEDGGETHACLQRLDDVMVDLIVDDVAGLLEVNRVNDLVVSVFLVAIQILGLTSVSYRVSAAVAHILPFSNVSVPTRWFASRV